MNVQRRDYSEHHGTVYLKFAKRVDHKCSYHTQK